MQATSELVTTEGLIASVRSKRDSRFPETKNDRSKSTLKGRVKEQRNDEERQKEKILNGIKSSIQKKPIEPNNSSKSAIVRANRSQSDLDADPDEDISRRNAFFRLIVRKTGNNHKIIDVTFFSRF